jgi:hypothetical protein
MGSTEIVIFRLSVYLCAIYQPLFSYICPDVFTRFTFVLITIARITFARCAEHSSPENSSPDNSLPENSSLEKKILCRIILR